ncbi:MAG TPA: tetratricopeptide repeat protein [Candidatus Goldiibacteriota bacterium]|nr:tetratricopeptide repeat protein [Candidatus Goldiibacteriota bacterium]HPN64738.1 tetratricopeptide repeat protein [Candidatus Goldiibacteriota bacterium]HRQ44230.1 tetratricopeptide repeat protein [Candidatus Goldiibacteriota bacterium]
MGNNNLKIPLLALLILFSFSCVLLAEDPFKSAEKLTAQGKYEEALKLYRTIRATYKGADWELQARQGIAKTYEKKGDLETACTEYKDIYTKYPGTNQAADAILSFARLKTALKDRNGALEAYKLYHNNFARGEYRSLAYFNMASIYREAGNPNAALKIYNEIINNYPEDIWIHGWAAVYSGDIYAAQKEYDKAIESYSKTIKTKENGFLAGLSELHKGQAFIEKKDFDSAEETFQTLLKNTNQFTEEALIGLGRAQMGNGEPVLAKEVFQSVGDLFPDSVWKVYADKKIAEINELLKKQK